MKRLFAMTLVLVSLVLLIACNAKQEISDESSANSEEILNTTEEEVTHAPVVIEDIAFTGGDVTYNVVRSEDASDTVIDAAIKLYTSLRVGDQNMKLVSDWVKPGDPIPEYEIIIGNADREEVRSLASTVPYCGYTVKVVGKKLVILAFNDDYMFKAVNSVIDLMADRRLVLKENYESTVDFKEGEYPLADAVLGDRKITEYSISSKKQDTADLFRKMIGKQVGVWLPIADKDSEGPKIYIGSSAKENFAPIEYYEYRIESKGEDVYFFAYGDNEYGHSFKVFFDMLSSAQGHKLALSETINAYKLPSREEYINDPSKLYMLWDYLWEAPEWMLDYEDKKASLFGGKGSEKLYASAHRAELVFYPENSIEAVISTYYMGAAIAELDFGATKDGILVLLHDDTLSRTTNVADFMGKPGYPNSANVSDWTYAQLMDLNLKEGGGGASAALTPFKIATLEEALIVCKERLFIVPDKYKNWQYVRSTDIMQGSKQIYLSDLMKKTGNCESILVSYGNSGTSNYLNAADAVELQKLLKAETGVTSFILFRCKPDASRSNYSYFTNNAEPNSFAIQLNGDYKSSTNYSMAYKLLGDKVTFLAWTIGTGDSWNDYRKNWEAMYNNGLRIIMTNDLFNLAQYCEDVGDAVMKETNS